MADEPDLSAFLDQAISDAQQDAKPKEAVKQTRSQAKLESESKDLHLLVERSTQKALQLAQDAENQLRAQQAHVEAKQTAKRKRQSDELSPLPVVPPAVVPSTPTTQPKPPPIDPRLAKAALQSIHIAHHIKFVLEEKARQCKLNGIEFTDAEAELFVAQVVKNADVKTDSLLSLQIVYHQMCRMHGALEEEARLKIAPPAG